MSDARRVRPILRALGASWRAAWMTALAYRANFLADAVVTLFAAGATVLPVLFVFHGQETIAGWTASEALLVTGAFVVLQGLVEAAVEPNLRGLVDDIRFGTLDYVLLRPVDPQLLVSFRRLVPQRLVYSVGGFVILGVAASRLPEPPGLWAISAALTLLGVGAAVMYALWLLVVSMAFWFVRVDNLSYLLTSAMDAARWPIDVFRPVFRVLFSVVVPLGLMTTTPALALRGVLEPTSALSGLGVAVVFCAVSRAVWVRALRHYSSASS